MPSLLQRQLFRELLHVFVLSSCVLLTLILISRVVQMRDLLLGLDMSIMDTTRLFAYMTPLFMMLVIPVACMLSVFLTFLRMGTDRELIALRAGGVSLYQMLPAPLLFSVLCMGLTLWVSLHWLAWGTGHFRSSLVDIAGSQARIVVQPGVFNNTFPDLVLFARQVDPENGQMRQVLVDDRSTPGRNVIILAPYGTIETEAEKGELVFHLRDGRIYSAAKNNTTTLHFEEYNVRLPLEQIFKSWELGELRPREMSWKKLRNMALQKTLEEDPALANKVAVELHKRWAYPAACLALAIFVLPLATVFQGMHRQTGLAIALVMFFVYYSLMSMGFSLGESGTLPPAVSLWLPNALFFVLGVYGLILAARESVPDVRNLIARLRSKRLQRKEAK